MTEKQDIKATKELGTSEWSYVGESISGKYKVYETNDCRLFATGNNEYISFEVIEDNCNFTVY